MDISLSNLGPVAHLREALSCKAQRTLQRLLGTLNVPLDAPNPSVVIAAACQAVGLYRRTLGPVRPQYEEFFTAIEHLRLEIARSKVRDHTPPTQLVGRMSEFPEWRFLMTVTSNHERLLIAAGAEVFRAWIHFERCNVHLFAALSTDVGKLSQTEADQPLDEEDLANLGFGKDWIGRYKKIDKALRQLILQPEPPGADRYEQAARAQLRIRDSIVQRAVYPSKKHRTGSANHRHLSKSQLRSVLISLRDRVAGGDRLAILNAIQILTGCPAEAVLQIPIGPQIDGHWCAHIDIGAGLLALNLDSIFPSRRRPPATSEGNFLHASPIVRSPLPDFLQRALERRHDEVPDARCIGDLLAWIGVDADSLLTEEPSAISPTIARARASLGLDAINSGVSRSVAAGVTWDFGLVPRSRIYYLRIDADTVRAQWAGYLDSVGWSVSQQVQQRIEPFGAHAVLSDDGLRQVVRFLADRVMAAAPGRHAGLKRLTAHHNAYATYVGAFVSFFAGLRPRRTYGVSASDWRPGYAHALTNDKRRRSSDFDRPVVFFKQLQLVLEDWHAHCAALHSRLSRHPASAEWETVKGHLARILTHKEVPLIFLIDDGDLRPIGHQDVWGSLPPHLATPSNAGRSFLASRLQAMGTSSFSLDLFLRHSAQGLEPEAMSRALPLAEGLNALVIALEAIHSELSLPTVTGLRSAS